MEIKEVVATLERFAPLLLQESYDNAGLQIGLTVGEEVSGVLLCLDVTEAVITEAEAKGCNLIVAHHPLLFRPLHRVTTDTQVGRCVIQAVQKGIAIYAAHTNLDNAPGGVNYEIAQKLEMQDVHFLQPLSHGEGGSGVIGKLAQPLPAECFLKQVAKIFGVEALMHNKVEHMVHTIALCGGSGEFLLDQAISLGADAFITGEMSYHCYFGHESDILIGVLGHYQSEQYTIQLLYRLLHDAYPTLRMYETSVNTNPIVYQCTL